MSSLDVNPRITVAARHAPADKRKTSLVRHFLEIVDGRFSVLGPGVDHSPPALVGDCVVIDAKLTPGVAWSHYKATYPVWWTPGAQLTVNEVVQPPSADGTFNLQIDGITEAAEVGSGGSSGPQSLTAGAHRVGETAGFHTKLSGYNVKIGGDCDADGNITLALDDFKTCTITNVAVQSCTGGLTFCSGTCVDTQTDSHNCHTCGNACRSDEFCQNGACTTKPSDCSTVTCSADKVCCDCTITHCTTQTQCQKECLK